MDSTFNQISVDRLEADQAVNNRCGNGALMIIRAACASIPRKSLRRRSHYLDQLLWSTLNEGRRQAKAVWGPKYH